MCLSTDVTGALVLNRDPSLPFVLYLVFAVLVCLSIDVTGALVPSIF